MHAVTLDLATILDNLGVENPRSHLTESDRQTLRFDDPEFNDLAMNNQKWLRGVEKQKAELGDPRALNVAKQIAGQKRRTLFWLRAIGYEGILSLWRENTRGLMAVVQRFESETAEEFSPSLILDFMESHDSWPIDLENCYRTHAFLHESKWQEMAENADEHNMVDVAKAKQLSQLAFERAGTLNRDKFSKVLPRDEGISGNVINVTISKDGINEVGVDKAGVAKRQQLTAMARVRYGTGQYIDPPGLVDWQRGDLVIPDAKVDDYLMLKWIPDDFMGVLPEAVAETAEVESVVEEQESPVALSMDNFSLELERK